MKSKTAEARQSSRAAISSARWKVYAIRELFAELDGVRVRRHWSFDWSNSRRARQALCTHDMKREGFVDP